VQPDSLLRWHHDLFRQVWKHRSRPKRKGGREPLAEDVVARIDARDYANAAANGLSVYVYLAEKVYGEQRSLEESRKNFERTLSTHTRLLILQSAGPAYTMLDMSAGRNNEATGDIIHHRWPCSACFLS
jgi:hypothetical protein